MRNILKKIFTINNLLIFLGFTCSYIVPIILFGEVIPYTRESLGAGLTKAGYIAVSIIIIIICKKIKEKIITLPKSLIRGLILSIFPILYWLVANIGVDYLVNFFSSVASYMDRIIVFIIIGRMFYCAEESLHGKELN